MTYRYISTALDGDVFVLTLNRPEKRNAIGDAMLLEIEAAFGNLPAAAKAVVLAANGPHFCAGLDLGEHHSLARSPAQFMHMCQAWHRVFDKIQYGGIPVIAALHGAVVGGGLELAAACQIRVAEDSAYFGLPEGQRGIFVGGGGSVRIPRLMGTARMSDMMLTGRVYDADEADRAGLVQYRVRDGEGLAKGIALAQKMAANAPMTAFAVMHALPRIVEQSPGEGLFTEALMAAAASNTPEAQDRLRAFLDGRAGKVVKS